MKKLLAVLALLAVSTIGLARDIVPVQGGGGGIFIIDGKKVLYCYSDGCMLVSSDYTKELIYNPGSPYNKIDK